MGAKEYPFIPYSKESFSDEETIARSKWFFEWMNQRRTIRDFSSREIPFEVLENIVRTASTAPSGAHKQPWMFCIVTNPELKRKIRAAAEQEEYESYNGRMTQEWLEDLAPIGTDWRKEFLEIAPALIVVFRKPYEIVNGKKKNNYYVNESAGLACGFLLAAIHHAGLAALTHTPSPMNFLSEVLGRPENEKPFLLIPVGYPSEACKVPDLARKSIADVLMDYK
jgi:iodotyrosine deiodinase